MTSLRAQAVTSPSTGLLATLRVRLFAELGGTLAPLLGFGRIRPYTMHAVTGEDLGLECLRQHDGRRREPKINGTCEVLPRDRDVPVGQMVLAQPDQSLSLGARDLVQGLGWQGGRFVGEGMWLAHACQVD